MFECKDNYILQIKKIFYLISVRFFLKGASYILPILLILSFWREKACSARFQPFGFSSAETWYKTLTLHRFAFVVYLGDTNNKQ